VNFLRDAPRERCVSYKAAMSEVCVSGMRQQERCGECGESGLTVPSGPRVQIEAYPTLPLTSPASGCHAIKGSSAVPEPSVLFKLGAGNKVGQAEMASPCSAM
jgi:hypothetical protein